jgi:AcrR family transcriptional regulator
LEEEKEKSFERREELLKAALIEFGDYGYDQASLNNILKRAEISKGTFYYHFKNKEDLYLYLYEILAEEKMDFFNKSINPEDFNKDIFTILKNMSKAGMEFARYRPEIDRFSSSYLKDLNNPILDKVKEKYDLADNNYFDFFIDKAYERGELREDLPRKFIKNMINYLLTNLQEITKVIDIDEYDTDVNYLIEFFKDGLGKK